MDYDTLFDTFNTEKNETKVIDCCDDTDNYSLHNGIIICKKCKSTITNIIDTPEWRFYGSEDTKNSDPTRCGMALNPLLPDSSVGTSIKNGSNKSGMYIAEFIRNFLWSNAWMASISDRNCRASCERSMTLPGVVRKSIVGDTSSPTLILISSPTYDFNALIFSR